MPPGGTPTIDEIIAENVVALTKTKRIGFQRIAEETRITPKDLRAIFRGSRQCSADELYRLAAAFEVDPGVLFTKGPAREAQSAIVGKPESIRLGLAKQFVETTILGHYRHLVNWQTVTNQSSQLDSGYLGQHLVSLLTGAPGRGIGSRGKGTDLLDGSEVKTASTLGGVDIPRWNNKLDSEASVAQYLSRPAIFFVLIDTVDRRAAFPVRVRVWKVQPRNDPAFERVVRTWRKKRTSGNLQFHPPCWTDTNVATNESGNLALPLMYAAKQLPLGSIDYVEVSQQYTDNPGMSTLQS